MPVAKEATIYERMTAILAELPPIGKTQKNTQQNFMFRGQDDMLNALNPLLAKHGVFIIPDVLERRTDHRTTAKGSIMFEVNLHVRFTAYGTAGDSVSGSAWGEGTDMGDKATSKAMTMAFKYWITQAFAISTAEASDPDRDTPQESSSRGRQPAANDLPDALQTAKSEQERKELQEAVQAGIDRLGPLDAVWTLPSVLEGATNMTGRPITAIADLKTAELEKILRALRAAEEQAEVPA